MKKVGIVACSNGIKKESQAQNNTLTAFLQSCGCTVQMSACIYERENVFSGSAKERAAELMALFADPEVEEIYDISGGDLANQILDDLDYEKIAKSKAVFWGYSDLTTVLNAIYVRTGKAGVLYQIKKTVCSSHGELQQRRYQNRQDLFFLRPEFVQGNSMKGIVIGGNIRCFLKLAGTRYFPDTEGKILLLEAYGGGVPQMTTYLSQLKQLGVFKKVSGILLGTFTKMEEQAEQPDIVSLLKEFVPSTMPIAKTKEIGHGNDSKAIWIGKEIGLNRIK